MKKQLFFLLLAPTFCTAQSSTNDSVFIREINTFVDAWHHAAAVADEDTFFGSMDADALYIGTDASERWLRDELKVWSKKYFDRESAWSFTPLKRHIYWSDDRQYVWFDETLATQMDVCRGSGVLQRHGAVWRFKQYVLSIAVPNEVVKDYLKLLKK